MAPDATAGSPEGASPAAAPARKAVKAPGAAADGPKLTALMLAIKRIEQMYGKGSLMRFGDRGQQLPKVEIISSGSMSLDHALGRWSA
jgi:recombination protein RecA